MGKIKAALIGAGQRGMDAYASYALNCAEDIEFVAVADISIERRDLFKRTHGVVEENCFASWEELLEGPKLADAVLICTQDQMHFEPAIRALEKGYHVLLEKPMSPSPLECLIMGEYAEKYERVFSICHVLRFTEFFTSIKKLLTDGAIGKLVTIQHTENVEHRHQAHSFVRGNWRNSQTSSPMILAKSCHDMDILLWLADADCTKVSSFGSLTYFNSKNAPEGAPLHCLDGCPVQDECPYYAPKIYVDGKDWMANVLRSTVSSDSGDEGVLQALKEGPYGRCVFHCDNNVVDHQVVNLEFANEVTVAFTMSAFTHEGGRSVKLMGTRGQIRGDMEKNEIEVTSFITGKKEKILLDAPAEGHGGGDHGIMRDFIRLVQSDGKEVGLTNARASVQSHLMAFAAEKSRVEGRVISITEYINELKRTEGSLSVGD
ncbi:gfo/Idh/MocA family oxidoreductase [Paenibacillus psychroresistens]|uniref:Gfo/Idh/MocA family oxidoreductase n=1 Tax=Paenibacillus psychroresistens TaxID=1778678 RepID=A0A6B8RS52_9BACL|nr:Gfo/Idh/MocA family oxidoreductase [Paenibacillus psychroresistens]QGQ98779.1 gfo/Idh/MocA family oxidoreductase [Paenibacillus psychroresistens]